jgi:hypothetical protein
MSNNISSNSSTNALYSYKGGAAIPFQSEVDRVAQHQRVPEVGDTDATAYPINAVEIALSRDNPDSTGENPSDPTLEYSGLRSNQSLADLLPHATLPTIHELRSKLATKTEGEDLSAQVDSSEPVISMDAALESALSTAELIRRNADASLHAHGSHLSREALSLIDENKGSRLRAKATYQAQANLLTRNSQR